MIAVDHFGDFDLQHLCVNRSLKWDLGLPYDVRHLLTACRDLTFDALIYLANLENYPSVVERLRRGRPLFGNGASVLAQVRDPSRFFGFLGRAGIPAPNTTMSPRAVELHPHTRWLRKPARSGGGHGIALHARGDALDPGMVLQEYMDGLPCSAVFVADGLDCRLLGISEQLVGDEEFGADGFRYCGGILGQVVQDEAGWRAVVERVRQVMRALTREFHLVGANGMDFILKAGAVYPLEVNPRYTASMELVERAFGINIFAAHLDACHGRLPDFDLGARSGPDFFGKAILFAMDDLVFHNPQRWYDRGMRDLPQDGEHIGRGKPVCTVFSRGRTRRECYEVLAKVAAEVRGAVLPGANPAARTS